MNRILHELTNNRALLLAKPNFRNMSKYFMPKSCSFRNSFQLSLEIKDSDLTKFSASNITLYNKIGHFQK